MVDDDDDDDESDADDEGLGNPFIAPGVDDDEEDDTQRRAARHARLDQEQRDLDGEDLEKIAANFQKRVRSNAKGRYTGDMNEVPQRLLMPSVHDASLWQIRVKVCMVILRIHFETYAVV